MSSLTHVGGGGGYLGEQSQEIKNNYFGTYNSPSPSPHTSTSPSPPSTGYAHAPAPGGYLVDFVGLGEEWVSDDEFWEEEEAEDPWSPARLA